VLDAAEPIRLAESAPVTSTRAVDLLIATDASTVAHVEFQTSIEARFPQRMLDYWLRLDGTRALAGRTIVQHVVFLGRGTLPDRLRTPSVAFSYTVHHLAREDPAQFLADPSLAPFAVLTRMADRDRPAVLARAVRLIAAVPGPHRREVLARATVDLAAIRLPLATIEAIWEEPTMPIPARLGAPACMARINAADDLDALGRSPCSRHRALLQDAEAVTDRQQHGVHARVGRGQVVEAADGLDRGIGD
jgi:hypothetical protein